MFSKHSKGELGFSGISQGEVTQSFDSEEPPDHNISMEMEMGGGDDDAIKRIKALIGEYKNYRDVKDDEEDPNRNPDFREMPGSEKIEEILRLIGGLEKGLRNQEAIVASLKRGDTSSLEALLMGPTML
ncbi:MAG: hypothetical protein UU08_C0018G0013 [Candidatus Uhrbacteria bacterium GW2011_GWE2_40_58]|nr:MAG: hypothetical protein UT94_C0022G0011 [Candidatus Uhrbacteria bacterium GW2011_GWF2_40_263]KKR67404.1 MAG: hypothetical protein UU08_C0018G0013 [Candidatus Uhrbacteria bacterium GW2011_GWE2_40_58]OGL94384.1 MAG: hypothetical protein A2239_00385 [Candidatus Uhrbacteria bacterium RIFOXYA2_FULL_40_9]OGL98150.1 MAG: hypothetical protein A2332_02960 [Candidatus Uhrbacteria bacterium RIFOXYB2_FULL_41_18]HBK34562.1 hypothetical protein [Candidatus Uhrbacteria bacterium]